MCVAADGVQQQPSLTPNPPPDLCGGKDVITQYPDEKQITHFMCEQKRINEKTAAHVMSILERLDTLECSLTNVQCEQADLTADKAGIKQLLVVTQAVKQFFVVKNIRTFFLSPI